VEASQFQPACGLRDGLPTLTVVLVNYQSWVDVQRLVISLEQEPEFASGQLDIVVVDNASQGPVPEHLTQLRASGFRLLLRAENGGFAVGVNAGWRLARSPWLLVLNPDVEIEKGSIGQVIERIKRLSASPERPPGIIGFGLRNPDGSIQGSVGVFPSLARTIREQFIPRSRRKYQAGSRIQRRSVDWVTGACMLLNCRMMSDVGGMDEDFFLYHEEVALSRSARDRGWRVEFDPDIQVVHRHPLQNRAVSPKMRVIIRHSKLLYFRKHLPGWQFRCLSWLVSMEAVVRGQAARVAGDSCKHRSWRLIGDLSRRLRAGEDFQGRDVLRLADSVESESEPRRRLPLGAGCGPSRGMQSEQGQRDPGDSVRTRSGAGGLERRQGRKDGSECPRNSI
jgi:GT2 family glycosyltransferase